MFKRIKDFMSGPSSNSSADRNPVEYLRAMGFSESDARHALRVNGGNVEQATDWLLAHNSEAHSQAPTPRAPLPSPSRARPQPPPPRPRIEALPPVTRTEAPASKPLTARKGIASHPNVKVPKALNQHDKEDVIMRCARRVAPHAQAVDTLLRSLRQLRKDPTNMKYRTIDTTTAGFQRSLNVPGAVDFFKAMGYHPTYKNINVLELSFVDPATLYLGISSLEQIQTDSPFYKESKAKNIFDKEIQQILSMADNDMQEAIQRSEFMGKVPSEPAVGGGQISIELGSTKVQRKFEGDDCLEDVINWLGGHGSVLPQKLYDNQWYLVNQDQRHQIAYNIQELKGKTLQYIGCWPSGRLAVIPTQPNESSAELASSTRGIGAAPIDALKL